MYGWLPVHIPGGRPPTNDMSIFSNATVEMRRLADVVEVLSGYSTGSALAHDVAGTHQVVMSKHLQPGLPYSYVDEDAFRITPVSSSTARAAVELRPRNISRYEVQPGDVLFMSRGVRNVATRIESVPAQSIAPVSFFVLRPERRELLDPAYLMWYLNTSTAQNEIANIRTGALTPIVQRSVFQDLQIPLPDMATQQRIGALGELMTRERLLQEQLAQAVVREHSATNSAIAHQLLTTANQSHRISQ